MYTAVEGYQIETPVSQHVYLMFVPEQQCIMSRVRSSRGTAHSTTRVLMCLSNAYARTAVHYMLNTKQEPTTYYYPTLSMCLSNVYSRTAVYHVLTTTLEKPTT